MMSDYLQTLSRILISVVFIVFGFLQFTNIGTYIASPAVVKAAALTGGILSPTVIAYLVAAIDLVGGLLILFGYQVRWAAVVLIGFVVLTLFVAHNFWTMEGAARGANQAHFYKNLALIGGLLALIVHGAGRYSLDHAKPLAR
jgi:putative oxidoreductase